MSEQHYFSETPETEFKPRPVQVELAGRKVTVTTANGIFSPSGIDKGTAILLQEAPDRRVHACSTSAAVGAPSP